MRPAGQRAASINRKKPEVTKISISLPKSVWACSSWHLLSWRWKNQIHRAAATSSLPSLAQVLMAQLKLYPRPGEQVWEPQGRTAPAKSPPWSQPKLLQAIKIWSYTQSRYVATRWVVPVVEKLCRDTHSQNPPTPGRAGKVQLREIKAQDTRAGWLLTFSFIVHTTHLPLGTSLQGFAEKKTTHTPTAWCGCATTSWAWAFLKRFILLPLPLNLYFLSRVVKCHHFQTRQIN